MRQTDYKKKYDELLEKYEALESEFKIMNRELYYIKCSRLYKMTLVLRKAIRPVRKATSFLNPKNAKVKKINKFLKGSSKVAIVPCSFEFDDIVNQRPINYAKYLSNLGYRVLYVVWQWDENTEINNAYKIVHENVLQIPLYDFLKFDLDFSIAKNKIFYINFPNEIFSVKAYELREQGFFIHYDIMDDWEEFQKVGQADWFIKSVEEQLILSADYVSAVSPFLVDKFKNLRKDIALSPNGYYIHMTGENNKNIARREIENGKINIGYFGHLTDSWFNWDMIISLAKKNSNYCFHIIGYGLSEETEERIKKCDNITYYGKVPMTQLYQYVRDWNIGIIPFKELTLAKAVDPIKIYEYIFMGLPTIVSGIKHLSSYPNTFVIETLEEFEKTVEKITIDSNIIKNADSFLENSTWEARFEKMMEEYVGKGVSDLYED